MIDQHWERLMGILAGMAMFAVLIWIMWVML
jgi:hypothetical protein